MYCHYGSILTKAWLGQGIIDMMSQCHYGSILTMFWGNVHEDTIASQCHYGSILTGMIHKGTECTHYKSQCHYGFPILFAIGISQILLTQVLLNNTNL
jgi:hypothetical protein